MNRTKIEYLHYTWNPIVGCSRMGCAVNKRCWAAGQAVRQKQRCDLCYSFTPHTHMERLEQPFQLKTAARIGACFMGEFFDKCISESTRAQIKMSMDKAPWHQFIVFTKQPQNIDYAETYPANMSIGVSINTLQDLWRIGQIRELWATCRIVSVEPLYECLSSKLANINLEGIHLLIIGGQTRPTLLPKPTWVWDLIAQARRLEIPVFLKDNLAPLFREKWRVPIFVFGELDGVMPQELPKQLCITPFEKAHHRLERCSKEFKANP